MSNQETIEQSANSTSKTSWLKLETLVVLFTAGSTLYFMFTEHKENMANIQRTTQMLQKYEHQLDIAISEDKNVLKVYQNNINRVMKSLDREQKLLLQQLTELDTQNRLK